MTRYIVDSGIADADDPLWRPLSFPLPTKEAAEEFRDCQCCQYPQWYGPGGCRQLRVREVGTDG